MDNKLSYLTDMVFNINTWKSVLGPHRFSLPATHSAPPDNSNANCSIQHSREFRLTDSYLNEWNQLFGGRSVNTIVPYSFHWPWTMEFLMHHLLPKLGLNLRHVLHLRQDAEYPGEYKNNNAVYSSQHRLIDLCPLEKNRVMLVTETSVVDNEENTVFCSRDFTIVLNVPRKALAHLNLATHWNRTALDFMDNGFRRKNRIFPSSEDAEYRLTYYCDDDFWLRFGIVSGAVSITHGYWLISRYFRKQDPFLQGMCTGNLVLNLLVKELGERLSTFSVSFSDKLYFPQQVELRLNKVDFELYDEKNRQVAFGCRKTAIG